MASQTRLGSSTAFGFAGMSPASVLVIGANPFAESVGARRGTLRRMDSTLSVAPAASRGSTLATYPGRVRRLLSSACGDTSKNIPKKVGGEYDNGKH